MIIWIPGFSNLGVSVVYFKWGRSVNVLKFGQIDAWKMLLLPIWDGIFSEQDKFCFFLVGLTLNGGLVRETPSPKVAFRFCLYPSFHPYYLPVSISL